MDFSKRYNREEFVKFLQNDFLPEDDFLMETTEAKIQQETKYIKGITKLGASPSLRLAVYEARHTSTHDARVGLSKEIFRFMANKRERKALVLFVPEGNDANYRLSLISIDLVENEDGNVKRTYSNPRRYSYYLGEGIAARTPKDYLKKKGRVKDASDLKNRFSVEILNVDFFNQYKAQYKKFCEFLYNDPEMCQSFRSFLNQGKAIRDYVKKMMGRIVFLYFVQRKGWLNGDSRYMSNMFSQSSDDVKADFLDRVLEPMFFGLLNTPKEQRNANAQRNGWDLSLIPGWQNIPYLNGGLFEQDEIDKCKSVFPTAYFEELFGFFDTYNFTIDENDPDDSEVGIDPEMLGHIFENLLEDNKDKGAFYTPKEIVQYMCRESVIQYLKTHEPDERFAEAIEHLIRDGEVDKVLQDKATARKFTTWLAEVKVCDPAIGSGAFPMGVLNVLYHSRQLLYGFTKENRSFSPSEVKREIIQNNIYGVDIEQGAVDIARLRFWLSLVVDEAEPQPLPNLDYKIVCGNSLLSTFDNRYIDVRTKTVNDAGYVTRSCVSSISNSKDALQAEQNRFYSLNGEEKYLSSIAIKKHILDIIWYQLDYERMSYLEGTKIQLDVFGESMKSKAKHQVPSFTSERQAILDKCEFLQRELNDTSKSLKERSEIVLPFFDWGIIFSDIFDRQEGKKGFDIVIGNPPYQRIQGIRNMDSAFADELVKQYKSAVGSFDLYAIFAEQGLRLISKDGLLNYIMPVKWTNAAFGKGLRGIVSETHSASKIINFGAYQVFNASTYTGLQWFKPNCKELIYHELDRDLNTNQELASYLGGLTNACASKIKTDKLNKEAWVLTMGQTAQILNKLEQSPRRIKDVFDKIFQGLATSKDDVYFLYDCVDKSEYVIGYSKQIGCCITIERGLVKPLLKGEDVHRYDNISTNRYVIFPYKIVSGKAILYTEQELAALYPQGYAYLKECEEVLRGREKGRLINDDFWFKYIYPKNLVLFDKEKLVAPDISLGGNFAYDEKGEFYSTTTIYGYIKKEGIKESYKFWMALLNSTLFWWFLTNTGTTLANGFFRFKPDYINPFPVPESITPEAEKAIEELVGKIISLKSANPNADISEYEKQIDYIMYKLYSLDSNEIRIIEG